MSGLSRDSGFTLVEVLVAMFIFSILSVGTFQAMTAAINSQERIQVATDRLAQIELARTLIKSDLSNLELVPTRDSYGTPDLYMLSGGVDNLLTFTRSARDNPGGLDKRGDLQRISYKFEDNSLIREALAQDNPAPQTSVYRQVLLNNLETVDIEFFQGPYGYSQLFIENKPEARLDYERLNLTFTFANGDELSQEFELRL